MEELYQRLKQAYSDKNLNRITGKLIALYRSKDFGGIRFLANRISEYIPLQEENDSRCFSRLIMLYHPDKGAATRSTIERLYTNGHDNELKAYSHILLMDETIPEPVLDEDIGYEPEYVWDHPASGFYYPDFDENGDEAEEGIEYDGTFYSAVKLRIYGNQSMEFPAHYLEDLDEIEMADSHIEILDGIEFCSHTVRLDLSGNLLTDIAGLWHLDMLEELFLADNHIGYIDVLSNLLKLRFIDLSGNEISDITPLLSLENLEYVNLVGNKVPKNQVSQLSSNGIIVMH